MLGFESELLLYFYLSSSQVSCQILASQEPQQVGSEFRSIQPQLHHLVFLIEYRAQEHHPRDSSQVIPPLHPVIEAPCLLLTHVFALPLSMELAHLLDLVQGLEGLEVDFLGLESILVAGQVTSRHLAFDSNRLLGFCLRFFHRLIGLAQ